MFIKSFDIIIPVYKPGENFLRLLEMLKKQSLKPDKLIIINTVPDNAGEWDKKTRDMLSGIFDENGSYIYKKISPAEFDHAGTRKAAAELSDADAFICMTDDAVPYDDNLTSELIKALNTDDNIALAYARQLPRNGAGNIECCTRQFNYPAESRIKSIKDLDTLGIKTFFASNVCCAYKKSIYKKLGGFVRTAVFNEDMLYAAKALKNGYSSFYAAEAKVIHSHSYTAVQQLHRNFDLGMSQAMNPEVFSGIVSEGEGIRLVKNTAAYLLKNHAAFELPKLVISSGFKYIGFRLGKSWEKLPDRAVVMLAMNKNYAEKLIENRRKP